MANWKLGNAHQNLGYGNDAHKNEDDSTLSANVFMI